MRRLNKISCWTHRSRVHMRQRHVQASPTARRRHETLFSMCHTWHQIRKFHPNQQPRSRERFQTFHFTFESWKMYWADAPKQDYDAPNAQLFYYRMLQTCCFRYQTPECRIRRLCCIKKMKSLCKSGSGHAALIEMEYILIRLSFKSVHIVIAAHFRTF